MNEIFQYLVQISLGWSKSKSFTSLLAYIGFWKLKISKDEPTLPFIPSPPPFILPNKVVPHVNVGVRKYENQIIDPPFPFSFPPYKQDLIQEKFGCFDKSMEPEVKINTLILKDNTNMHKLNIVSNSIESISSRDTYYPLTFISHDPL